MLGEESKAGKRGDWGVPLQYHWGSSWSLRYAGTQRQLHRRVYMRAIQKSCRRLPCKDHVCRKKGQTGQWAGNWTCRWVSHWDRWPLWKLLLPTAVVTLQLLAILCVSLSLGEARPATITPDTQLLSFFDHDLNRLSTVWFLTCVVAACH